MSEQKLVSPLLDHFVLGNPMSEHDGIRCHPAMKEGSDEKYIVKIISIPASQVQLDALLLTGAYKDPADAMDYFKEVADGIVKEVETLQALSKLDGFLSYEDWQVVPKEGGLGNEIYLLGSYKRSLQRHMQRTQMTHLEAVNLGLDLCQALAICRRSGYMYVDLKPSNVFISKNKEYRIGDVGFVELDSLKYTSLPGKYFSAYSAPEGKDALKTLNESADTYSVGMILYQVFNDGILPTAPVDPAKPFLPPVNADYEISAIIMKAISPNPEERWKDPMEMGQALIRYMQRNSVNNTPLVPATELITDPEAPALVQAEAAQTKVLPSIQEIRTEQTVPYPTPPVYEVPEQEPESEPENREDAIAAEISSLFVTDEEEVPAALEQVPEPESEEPADSADFDEEDDFQFDDFLEDTEPEEDFSEEDEFIEDVPALRQSKERKPRKPISKKLISGVITIMILALLACGGMWYYQNIYLQSIDEMEVVGTLNDVTVTLTTNVDESLLSVTCTDTYGNTDRQPVTDGKATFTDLLPNSQYKIQVEVDGFHKLTGKVSEVFNTAAQTNVVSFTAVTGPEDGSVLLNLVVDGTDPGTWEVAYSAQGEEEKTESFDGHSVTIKGLTVGKTYTFTLQNPAETVLTGESTLEYTSSALVMADNLAIISCNGGNLTVSWNMPEGVTVDSWTVRCYNDAGFEQVLENVTETQATFTDVDTTQAYTVEVTASGMTQPIRTSITTNPITITSLSVSEEEAGKMDVTWEYEGKAPVGGWLLMYKIDNAEKANVVKCEDASAVISPRIPGADYHFEIQAADSTSIFSNLHDFTASSAEIFEYEGLSGEKVETFLLKTPGEQDWTYDTISDDDLTDTFASGESISVVLHGTVGFYIPELEISALYVIRDSEGNVLPDFVMEETLNWKDLWYDGDPRYGELDLAVVPTAAGSYSVSIYFNGASFASANFTIQ